MHVFIYQFIHVRMQEKTQEKSLNVWFPSPDNMKSEEKLPYFFHLVLFWFSLFVHLKYMTVLSTKT